MRTTRSAGNFLEKLREKLKDPEFRKEVGLGKTVEAGLIMRELKLRARNGYDEVKSWFVEIGSKANVEVSHV